MRPIRLEIKGFTAFRDMAEIDFSSMDLVAITGPTGAGKTSIIDAILYALYGRTPRIGEKSVSDLITQGTDRLTVLLEFSAGQKRFRIARSMKKTAKHVISKPQLEVQKPDASWEALVSGVAEVKKKIEEIIGLDFDGFTKSVVLPQGEFDRFLKGDPKERREILSELLKLDIYTKMGQRAREISEQARSEIRLRENLLQTTFMDATEDNRKVLVKEIKQIEQDRRAVKERLSLISELLPIATKLRQHRTDSQRLESDKVDTTKKLQQIKMQRQTVQTSISESEKKISTLTTQIQELGYNQQLHLKLIQLVPKAKQLRELMDAVSARARELERSQQEFTKASAQLSTLEKKNETATRAKRRSETLYSEKEKAFTSTREKHGSIDLIRETLKIVDDLPELASRKDELEKQILEGEEKERKSQKELGTLQERVKRATADLRQAKENLEHLQDLHAANLLRKRLTKGEPCPVCTQTVKSVPPTGRHEAIEQACERVRQREEKRDQLRSRLSKHEKELEIIPTQLETVRKNLGDIKRSISRLQAKVTKALGKESASPKRDLSVLLKKLLILEEDVGRAKTQLSEASQSEARTGQEFRESKHKAELLTQQVRHVQQANKEDQKKITSLQTELSDWGELSKIEHQLRLQETAKMKRSELEEKRQQESESLQLFKQDLVRFETEMNTLMQKSDEVDQNLKRISATVDDLATQLKSKVRGILELEPASEAHQLEQERSRLENQSQYTNAELARKQQRLEQLVKQIKEGEEIRQRIKELKHRADLAHELGLALRGDQFIAFIEEEALRRLASDGTRHLIALSSGRYSFAVSDDNFHAVDHWNADEPRPVSTLSGGESFLASLSLALSLSESLSTFCIDRDRFSLDSLFLDEGFSTLDPETLDIVIQGIESLAAGDRLIGAISHIPEFAERFPYRIQVRKAVGGSTIVIG